MSQVAMSECRGVKRKIVQMPSNSALVTTEALITRDPAKVAAAVRAIVRVKRALEWTRVRQRTSGGAGSRQMPPL